MVITQKVDENDDLLGFFVGWLREFSKYFEKVFVITLAKGEYELPANVFVYSLGKERGSGKFLRIIRFYRYLFKFIFQSRAIFVHMSPIFAIASWPAAFIFRKNIFLWYLHCSLTFRLKIAEKLCSKILTADKDSLNLKSRKIIELGHGIDIERFKIKRSWKNETRPLRILSVGRISKIKNYETLIEAAQILKDRGLTFEIKIVGRPVMPYDFEYFEELKKLVGTFELEDSVEFIGFVPYSQIADYYKKSDIFVNPSPRGGIDKAVLEAMAAGCIPFVSNEVFEKYFGELSPFLIFKHGDSNDLAEKIENMSKLPEEKIEKMTHFFEESVSINHSLSNTISKIPSLFNL